MSDAVVSLLVSDVLWRLTSPAVKKFRLLRGLEDDISALRVTLEQIQAVLQDAEVKQKKLKAVETWLKNLRSVALEMENVLDEVASEASLHRLQVQRGVIYRARAFFSSNHNQIMVRYRITSEVKNIRIKFDAIAANRSNFGLTHVMLTTAEAGLGGERKRRETSSLVSSSMIYGRDSETEMIIQKICNKDMVRHYVDDIRVYAIWGMGGVGKTTLAQLVYNHEKVRSHFNVKIWVHVSTEFDIEKLIRGIIESIDGFRCRLSQLDAMLVELQNKLRGKKFLIVLDDVWIEDRMKWEELSKALSCGTQDSIVMVTTRSQKISTMMAKVPDFLHKVGCLSEEDSWAIFKNVTFGVGREGEDSRVLEPIGMEIVKKCKGLPLAVKAMSSLMWSKTSVAEWERVNQSDIWELQQNEVHILPALEISYDNLLPHMKRCFAYCCIFPKGYEMAKDQLIQLWVANGFVSSRGEAYLYVLGEEVFDCLVLRSFFQEVHDVRMRKSIDKVFIMHDLMHNLGRYVMRHECCVIEPGKTLITPEEVLHISSTCADFLFDHDSDKLRSLRSIFIFANEYKGKISQIFEYRYLRVLHLIGIGGTTLPESICELKHMRYLNLSGSSIHVLPKSIINLQNLQVLILHSCMELRNLPEGIRYMRKLEYLDIKNCYNLKGMPVGMKELTRLRRLSNFVVGYKNAAGIGDLGDLNLLGGELELVALDYVKDLAAAKSANLKCKQNLISLILSWSETFQILVTIGEISENVLEGLEPNLNLQELEIRSYRGSKFSPSWMVKLTNLVIIKFRNCEIYTCISPLGKLPNLKHIDMCHMPRLKSFHDEDNTTSQDDTMFPSLQELSIVGGYFLVSLPSNLLKLERLKIEDNLVLRSLPSSFPKLKELDVINCSELCSLPDGLESLTHLRITGCQSLGPRCNEETGEDWPKICHVPNISIIV